MLAGGSEYELWLARYHALGEEDHAAIQAHIARLAAPPRISLVMPVHATPLRYLREAIGSVLEQLYPHWELCIADDASPDPAVRAVLRSFSDPRIRVVERPEQGGISAATNSALALVRTEWMGLLDHDDRIARQALYMFAAEIEAHPEAAMIFSDEDAIDDEGRRFQPHFKPDWNPELMLGQNAVNHLGLYRTDDVRAVGGFRPETDGSQDWDLALRVADRVGPGRIRHVPHVLYHWRQPVAAATFSQRQAARTADAATRAVEDHLARTGQVASVRSHGNSSWKRVLWPVPSPAPMVSLVVAGRDAGKAAAAARRILAATEYPSIEAIAAVDIGAAMPRPGAEARLRIVAFPKADDPTVLRNRAVEEAAGEVVVFLDDDVTPLAPAWLAAMVGQVARSGIGAVGPMLHYADERVRNAGLLLGASAIAQAAHRGRRSGSDGYFGRAALAQDLSAVSGACLATPRTLFRALGGFDGMMGAYADVDYCLRLRQAGYRVIWTPLAELRQDGPERAVADRSAGDRMRARWQAVLEADPAGNLNLSVDDGDFHLAYPPRV